MTKEASSSTLQIVLGAGLGLLLQPIALGIGSALWNNFHGIQGGDREQEALFTIALFFGVMQAFAIVPAALLFYLARKNGVVQGLLFCGTFLALSNVLLWIFVYKGFFNPKIP